MKSDEHIVTSNQYSRLKTILNMFQIHLFVAIWLVLETLVINYALSMVDRRGSGWGIIINEL